MSNRINKKMILYLPNVQIKPLHEAPVTPIARWQLDQKAHLLPWLPEPPQDYFSEEFWQRKIWQSRLDWERQTAFRFVLWQETECIGRISLFNIQRKLFKTKSLITYSLSKEKQGKGIMRNALDKTLSYGHESLKIDQYEAQIHPENTRSLNLIKELHFTQTELKKPLKVRGQYCDHFVFIRNKKDFQKY